MLRKAKPVISLFLTLVALTVYWGCDRLEGKKDPNQIPVVEFVNIPFDSTTFSYAPVVYWTGHDPDGLLTGYEYLDDASQEAVNAYQQGDAALQNYINSRPDCVWVFTTATEQTIYLLTEPDQETEHVFMLRSVDDQNARSQVKVHSFFRTNQAPNPPEVRYALDETGDGYSRNVLIADTLLVGDTLTVIYPGIQLLWRATDPDSRALNIIPLEFSYVLVNTTTGDTVSQSYLNIQDSTVVTYRGWSPWRSLTQVVFYGLETGNYLFTVKVRDDGLTEADSVATVEFKAIKPLFDKQLLMVLESKQPTQAELLQGGIDTSQVNPFYRAVLPSGFALGEFIRQGIYAEDIPEPFVYNEDQVGWYNNSDGNQRVPYDLIQHYKWVWIVDDDNTVASFNAVELKQEVLTNYLNVGGGLMISGRRVFSGDYGLNGCDVTPIAASAVTGPLFANYFNISNVCCKTTVNDGGPNDIDFNGATTTNPFLAELKVDTAKVHSIRFGNTRYYCLPQVDYIGRDNSQDGEDNSNTLFNYSSCSVDNPDSARSIDMDVQEFTVNEGDTTFWTTSSRAYLMPSSSYTRILPGSISRIYNRTKNVYGAFIALDQRGPSNAYRIVVSTPVAAGAWTDSDTLEVDFGFIPISRNHEKPAGISNSKVEGTVEIDFETGSFTFIGNIRCQTALFTFPFSFCDTTHVSTSFFPDVNPVSLVIAQQLVFFNSPKQIIFNSQDGGDGGN